MKKILLFAILLSISSGVGASTNFYLTDFADNDEIGFQPSDTFEVLLWYTGDPIISFDVEVGLGHWCPVTILGGTITATGRNPEYNMIEMPGSVYGYDIELAGAADTGSLGSGLSNPLAKINFHLDGIGLGTLDLYDVATFDPEWNQIYPICHGAIIYDIIPEPATMILLSLGGLLFSRRRQQNKTQNKKRV